MTVPDPYLDHEVAYLATVQRGCGPISWFSVPTMWGLAGKTFSQCTKAKVNLREHRALRGTEGSSSGTLSLSSSVVLCSSSSTYPWSHQARSQWCLRNWTDQEESDCGGDMTTSHTWKVFLLSEKIKRKDAEAPSPVYCPVRILKIRGNRRGGVMKKESRNLLKAHRNC